MSIRLNGSTSGYTEIDAPAVAGSNTLVLPTGNGSSGQVLSTNGSGALSWVDRFSAAGPAFRAEATSNLSVTNGSFTKVLFQAESFDTGSCFDTSNSRFTPNVAGYYFVSSRAQYGTNIGTAESFLTIYVNGSALLRGTGGSLNSTVTGLVYLNGSTDYMEIYALQQYSSAITYSGSGGYTFAQAFLARPA